jgi:hypothetical protein
MIEIKSLEVLKSFLKTNDKCKKIVCLDNKSMVIFIGKVYINLYDYAKFKNFKKIMKETTALSIMPNLNWFFTFKEKSIYCNDILKNKVKSIGSSLANEKIYLDESFNYNFASFLENQGKEIMK